MPGAGRALLVAALAAACTWSTAAPAPARPHRTVLVPMTEDRGPAPRVTYYDRRSHLIHDGRRSVPARFPGLVTQVAEVRGVHQTVCEPTETSDRIRPSATTCPPAGNRRDTVRPSARRTTDVRPAPPAVNAIRLPSADTAVR